MTTQPHLSEELIEQSRERLRRITAQLTKLCRSTLPIDKFLAEFLARLSAALGAQGGVFWQLNGSSWVREQVHALDDLSALDVHAGHASLVHFAASRTEPTWLESGARSPDYSEAHNPTECCLYLCPIVVDRKVFGVVELFQRPNLRESTRQGQLDFLRRMTDEASLFVGRCQVGSLTEKLQWLERLADLQRELHRAKDASGAWYALASAVRRAAQADRGSIACWRNGSAELAAVSGQSRFDPRSNAARRLQKLLTLVGRRGKPIWNSAQDPQMPAVLLPAWKAHQGETECSAAIVLPIPFPENVGAGKGPWQAVLCLEWFEGASWDESLPPRAPLLLEAAAWGADRVRRRSRWWSWNRPAGRGWFGWGATWAARLAILGAIGGAAAALAFVQADLLLEARGTLEPVRKRDVFARADGEVVEVKVDHGAATAAGAEVARLRDENLEFRLQQLVGQRERIEQVIASLQAARLHGVKLNAEQQTRLAADLGEQRQALENLLSEERLLRKQLADLSVRSPLAGVVTTWNVAESLLKRPVRRGQVLMSVADPSGPWRLELQLAEEHWGLFSEAQKSASGAVQGKEGAKNALPATFVLATDPRTVYDGQVERVAERAEVDAQQRNRVGVRVAFDKGKLRPDLLRPGASATVKINCGPRPLGVVWFHDLADWFRREVWFRFLER